MPVVKLGEIVLGSRILLIDPCYQFGGKNSDGVSRKCVTGTWDAFFEYGEGLYGPITSKLIAVAPNDGVSVWKTIKHALAVDGAALGIFDCERYPRTRQNNKLARSLETFQSDYRKALQSEPYHCGVIDEGAVSYTRYGDGRHWAELVMNVERKACKAIIYL